MKRTFTVLLVLFLCSIHSFVHAQLSNYTFQQNSGTYSEITGGTLVGSSTATTGDGASLDDTVFASQALPFSFKFNGVLHNSYSLSSNGFITFGATLPAANLFTPISSNTAYDGAVSVLGRDIQGVFSSTASRQSGSNILTNVSSFSGVQIGKIIAGGGIPAGTTITAFDSNAGTITMSANASSTANFTFSVASGEIRSETTGPSGSRIHIIQFSNFRKFNTTIDNFNFQIRLYEQTNIIEYVYGTFFSSNTNAAPQVGLRGATNASFRTRTGTNWAASTGGFSNTSAMTLTGASRPASGQTYRWIPPYDINVSVVESNITNGRVYASGKPYDFTAVVRNLGLLAQSNVPVYYTVNNGPAIGPVIAAGPINPGASETVNFTGGLAFAPATPGNYLVKIFTALAGDEFTANDTLTANITVGEKITAFPYLETFSNPVGWTSRIERTGPANSTPLWILGVCTNPADIDSDTAARCNFFGPANNAGRREVLRSPVLDLSSLTNPVLQFYVSYRSFQGENDSMEVLVSTDAGITFFSSSTVFNKSNSTFPSLATRPQSQTNYFPDSSVYWRSETVSLGNVAGYGNVIIGFRGKSNYGNNAWIDNVVVTDASGLCTDNVTAPGSYNCNALLTLTFADIGQRPDPEGDPVITSYVSKESIDAGSQGSFNLVESDYPLNFVPSLETDNPGGGVATIIQHTNSYPPSVAQVLIAPNTTATSNDGSIFTPALIYPNFWFTASYTGNDRRGYALYDVSIDLDGLSLPNPDRVYILKRSDMTDSWHCQNTTRSGNILTVSGLSVFCDLAIAGNDQPLPVELSSFVSFVSGRDVTLKWTTSTESNNSGFDIERKSGNGSWLKAGFVEGKGNSSVPQEYSFADRALATGTYNYRLKQIDFNGNFEYHELSNLVSIGIPDKFALSQNYPNPFNPTTKINFDMPVDGRATIKLFDISGREVASVLSDFRPAGYHTVTFNASGLSSGVYFYRLSVESAGSNYSETKKMTLLK